MNQQMYIYKWASVSLSWKYKTFFIAHIWNTQSLENYTDSTSVAWCIYVSDTAWPKFFWRIRFCELPLNQKS